MPYKLTEEQLNAVRLAQETGDNILISAYAGSAKTYTLKLIANALPRTKILCLAFNKKIANEMQQSLPPNCHAQTLNSLGLSMIRGAFRHKVYVSNAKTYEAVSELIKQFNPEVQSDLYGNIGMLISAVGRAKSLGHIPDELVDVRKNCERLMNDEEMLAQLDEEPTDEEAYVIIEATKISLSAALSGRVDFDDMLLLPSVYKMPCPRFSLVLVDEAQDLSPLNHQLIKKIARKRLIAVGDSCQAIYAFRGADTDGMSKIKDLFNMTEARLTTSFRCPQEIVDHVRWRAPDMQAWDQTPAGSIVHETKWSVADIPDGAAIICRNNAPLFNMAITLLKNGRSPDLWGNDIAAGLLKDMKKLGTTNMSRDAAMLEVSEWEEKKSRKAKNTKGIKDRAECMRIFLRETSTLGEAVAYATSVLNSSGKVHLMTGHKAKGHEFNNVYFLDQHLVGKEGQEPNLRYVICTRTTGNLTYIDVENCIELQTDEEG